MNAHVRVFPGLSVLREMVPTGVDQGVDVP
ncbi:hypothetical protein BKA05_001822 [Nocardioides marinus]|jgi:hypothetical protein|uniref:Uncharacterized protein n=1 Tax=Nocardioides marinus TaxID=374514 RepID=A0A7Y9YFW8_9ACTN|nr:hypothetical protein [Nocardioides marinus]